MAYKNRSSYDDMGSGNYGGSHEGQRLDKKSQRIIISLVLIGLLLCVAVVVLWFSFFSDTAAPAVQVEQTAMIIDMPVAVKEEISPATRPLELTITTPEPTRPSTSTHSVSKSIVYTEHTVEEGQTLQSISEQYGISTETILSLNAIKNLSAIKPPLKLKIPDRNGQLYTVQSGDSLSIITNRFNPDLGWKTLQELNDLSSDKIFPGQKIFIPSAQVGDDGSLAFFDRFIRPAEGRITGLFGQTVVYGTSEQIVVLQGIWIEGTGGSKVEASGSGTVVDAGNEPATLGRFVTLSHENGYRTTYAHLAEVQTKLGDTVKQGEQIGTMGSSGNIGKIALYFSIEQEGIALNPANFF
jgi:murein DD-endopeptidase MepM/ murein hydrolase activator NlpD